jgi:hypothetical protein
MCGNTHKGRDYYPQDQRHNVRPSRKSNILSEDNYEAKEKADDNYGGVPPPWCFLVVLGHMLMMSIVIAPCSCGSIRYFDVRAPK